MATIKFIVENPTTGALTLETLLEYPPPDFTIELFSELVAQTRTNIVNSIVSKATRKGNVSIINGAPGAGKTTILKQIVHLSQASKADSMFVYLLKEDHQFKKLGTGSYLQFIKKQKTPLVFIIDGIDQTIIDEHKLIFGEFSDGILNDAMSQCYFLFFGFNIDPNSFRKKQLDHAIKLEPLTIKESQRLAKIFNPKFDINLIRTELTMADLFAMIGV